MATVDKPTTIANKPKTTAKSEGLLRLFTPKVMMMIEKIMNKSVFRIFIKMLK